MSPGRSSSPDTVCLLGIFALMGFILAVTGYVPPSVEAITPAWGAAVWGGVLAGSSTLALVGVLWRGDQPTGWVLELAGRPGIAATCIGYALALFEAMDQNLRGVLGVALFGAVGVASLIRTVQLTRQVGTLASLLALIRRWGRS